MSVAPYICDVDESFGLADAITITTYDAKGAEVDTAYAHDEEAASVAARTLLEDAADAGLEARELTVVFKFPGRQPLVLGRDVTIAA